MAEGCVTLEVSSYTITITAVINGVRHEDMQQTFTFTVNSPAQELPATNVGENLTEEDLTTEEGDTADDGQRTGEGETGEDNDTETNPENPNELPQTLNGGSPRTQSARPPANTPPSDSPSSDNLDGQPPPGNQLTESVDEPPIEPAHENMVPQMVEFV